MPGKAKSPAQEAVSRRAAMGTFATSAGLALFLNAHKAQAALPSTPRFIKDKRTDQMIEMASVNGGVGTVAIKYFGFEGNTKPNILLHYSIPPGASEGVHTHRLGDKKAGSFDEFYTIISGTGVMQIDGEMVPVQPGDHVFTPNGVAHGIENTSKDANLEVFLIAVER